MKDITLEDVKNILRIEVRKSLLHIHHYELGTNVFSKDKLNESISKTIKEEERLRDRLEKDYKETVELIEREVDKILITQDIEPDNKSIEYKGLVRRWIELKLMRQDWKRDLLNETGKNDEDFKNEIEEKWKLSLWDNVDDVIIPPIIEGDIPEPQEPYLVNSQSIEVKYNKVKSSSSPFFSTLYPKHLEEMSRNRRRQDTIGETEGTYQELIELIGDKPVGDYTNVDGRDYRNILSKLPKNRKRTKKYKNKTLKEILSMKVPVGDRITTETQMKLTSRMTSLWNYLIDEYPEYVDVNVFKKKSVGKSIRKRKDKKESFTDDDLHIIFHHKNYLPYIFENPFSKIKYPYYWIPILGCLTGCRLEELCMMRVKDIIKVDGVWVYRIREEGEYGEEETKVKNPYSERDVPLHSVLVDTLGFIKYVNHIKKLGEERVFYELLKIKNKYQKYVGRFFNDRYLKKIGLKDTGRSISFHSMRHSVETHLTNQNVNPRMIDGLQGHSQKGIGGSVYMKGVKPEVLMKECVDKIDWGIDWENLKVDWKQRIQS
ncbi:site-specific integrase [Deltaproteobacteria bacterium]|nr:site-specific integrase [Deltaproteobacteria bacterium]